MRESPVLLSCRKCLVATVGSSGAVRGDNVLSTGARRVA